MRLWLTKLSVVLITFMTFGIFIPPTYLDAEAKEQEVHLSKDHINDPLPPSSELEETLEEINTHEQLTSYVIEQAKLQSLQKFGPKISKHVADEFLTEIMPKIEEVIVNLMESTDEELLPKFVVTEKPSSGYGEKIFHIYHEETLQDVARFHVRRVNHPREGHSFNFHYHLYNDQFEQHYHLGDIFWDKNTPPKWMS